MPGVAGTWKDLTDTVNFMAANLTAQVRNIAEVATAIAGGDLSKKIIGRPRRAAAVEGDAEYDDRAAAPFAAEVTRVAREVGPDGSSAARRWCPAPPAPGRTSPTT